MSDFVILSLILFLVVCLILTLGVFVLYSGLLSEVVVGTGSPPVKKITIAYKFKKGSYRDRGSAFTECCSIAPKLASVGLYYDNPNQTEDDACRYAVGSILTQDEEKPDEELQSLYEKFGFRIISFPEVSCAVTTSFPNRCMLSPICGAYRAFPELQHYITDRGLSAYPYIEICKRDLIYYMCPLENQESFFVPELLEKQAEGGGGGGEETEKDGEEDETHTGDGCRSESGAAVTDAESGEMVESPAPVVQHSPRAEERDSQVEEADQGAKGSSESVGSGSSFEELDMDVEEEEKEKEHAEEEVEEKERPEVEEVEKERPEVEEVEVVEDPEKRGVHEVGSNEE